MILPKEVKELIKRMKDSGFEAYAVGGCVRDFLLGKKPNDWDVATNATPEEIQTIFKKSLYKNNFGTVTVFIDDLKIEVTTYRIDKDYTDSRHPDKVYYTKNLEEDLKRRDFTINAMALSENGDIIDPFLGQNDLKNRKIKAVGDPEERFKEDALRLMRAIRFASQLDFSIDNKTKEAIKKISKNIAYVSQERIRDELIKIVNSDKPKYGFNLMLDLGILKIILPEVEKGVGVSQNKHHIYSVYEHNINAMQYSADKKYSTVVRFASLLHDVGKPQTKRGKGENATFYNHDIVGAKIAKKLLKRLKFPNKEIDKISLLVRYHLFYYNVGEVTESSVRRLIAKVGLGNMNDLMRVRYADRIGSGTPKAEPYKLRHLRYVIDKVSRDPISVKMLKIKGDDLMKELDLTPSPKVGLILNALLSYVLDDSSKNNKNTLLDMAKNLNKLPNDKLKKLVKSAEKKIGILEKKERDKFRV